MSFICLSESSRWTAGRHRAQYELTQCRFWLFFLFYFVEKEALHVYQACQSQQDKQTDKGILRTHSATRPRRSCFPMASDIYATTCQPMGPPSRGGRIQSHSSWLGDTQQLSQAAALRRAVHGLSPPSGSTICQRAPGHSLSHCFAAGNSGPGDILQSRTSRQIRATARPRG